MDTSVGRRNHTYTDNKHNSETVFVSISQSVTPHVVPSLGNTYDRSIMVDEEEASILLYDIWEQVSHRALLTHRASPCFTLTALGMRSSPMLIFLSPLPPLQDNSQWLKEQCMRMGDAYIIVYSVTDKSSFEKASELRIQLRRARQSENIPIILVGNKSDLVRSREVSVDGESDGKPYYSGCRIS